MRCEREYARTARRRAARSGGATAEFVSSIGESLMAHAQLPVIQRGFGETARRDAWWVQPVVVFIILSSFVVYATWAALQNGHYTYGPYLSPFYAPELFGSSPHAWFGPKPGWWPGWL